MGITPPSFYAAFGSKEALFRRVIDKYKAGLAAVVDDAFTKKKARAVVETLLIGLADRLTDPRRAPGCLVLNSALPIDAEHSFRIDWAEDRAALRLRLEERLREAQGVNDLPQGADPAALAQMTLALVWGFAVDAQSGVPRAALHRTIAQFMKLWPAARGLKSSVRTIPRQREYSGR